MFQHLTPYHGGAITFGGDKKCLITGIGMIGMYAHLSIDNILFVEGLKGNLLSISQLCNNGYDVSFNKDECIVKKKDESMLFSAKRKRNLYRIKIGEVTNQNVSCMLTIKEKSSGMI